jgi:hypothetical protein
MLTKEASLALFSLQFLSFLLTYAFPPFALMQKVEPKNQGKPEPLRASCRPTHSNSHYNIDHSFASLQAACFCFFSTFSKPPSGAVLEM